MISSVSFNRGCKRFSETISEATKSLNQYLVSLASFKAISNLWRKSFLDCPDLASIVLAPMEVPDLNN